MTPLSVILLADRTCPCPYRPVQALCDNANNQTEAIYCLLLIQLSRRELSTTARLIIHSTLQDRQAISSTHGLKFIHWSYRLHPLTLHWSQRHRLTLLACQRHLMAHQEDIYSTNELLHFLYDDFSSCIM